MLDTSIKIALLTSVHPCFDVRIFHKEAKTLAKVGYETILIAKHDKEEIVDGIRIIPLPTPKNRFDGMTKIEWELFKLALRENADIYHFHDPQLIPVGLALKLWGRKVIFDVHEHYPNSFLDRYWIPKHLRKMVSRAYDLFERLFVPFFDYVIYTNPIVGERYHTMNVQTGQIENYPSLKFSGSSEKTPQKNVIFLGAMSKIRGITELIEAFCRVAKKYPNWKLYLVGKASPSSFGKELEQLISQFGVKENVHLLPWVPYEEAWKLCFQASIGIVTYLPYKNNMSCLSNKLFEYMLAGLPVIASDFPLYRAVIEKEKCGLLVDPTAPEEIASAMEYLIQYQDEAVKMGENGRIAVQERYNWEKESQKLLKIYDHLCEK